MTERFFFFHAQKTAGTSLFTRLQHHFGERAVYPDGSDENERGDAVLSVQQLRERWQARSDEIRVVTGHFPLCAADLLGGRFTTLTILREPVERTLSYLRHRRVDAPEDRDKSLEEIYRDPYRFDALIHNHMTKMFSLTPDEANAWQMQKAELFSQPPDETAPWILTKVEFTPDRLERAKVGLASVDLIGLQESFEEFCSTLGRRLGWDLGPPLHQNRTEQGDVPVSLRARIAEDNAMDIELYEFGRSLYKRRLSAPRSVFMGRR
jgi:hypothetical protein